MPCGTMRILCRRGCINYVFTLTMVSILLALYIAALRHNQDIQKRFHFKRLKVKRDLNSHIRHRPANMIHLKEPPHADISHVPNSIKHTRTDPLHVYIVDEHHEVIPYWFTAADKNLIPKSGNTVIHIDGHADLAQPVYVPGFPFFIYPRQNELKFLMQTNDAFIQASAIVGLVNRVIWVWPNWDDGDHEVHYVMSTLSLGYIKFTDQSNHTKKGFCVCMKNGTKTECRTLTNGTIGKNERPRFIEDEGFSVPRSQCRVKKIIIIEEVHENNAWHYFKKSDWISENENLILDIDEDYYGCGYAIAPLLKANLSYNIIYAIDNMIKSHLCPADFSHEKETDRFLLELIGTARDKRVCSNNGSLKHTETCQNTLKIKLLSYFGRQLNVSVLNGTIHMCSRKNAQDFVNDLFSKLAGVSVEQLRVLHKVGFCLNTSPKTLAVLHDKKFGLCIGANTPKHTSINEHMPTETEIATRSIVLNDIFKRLGGFSVCLVTVSRSMRDGYTPREFFEQIEKDILVGLNVTMERNIILHYDNHLLGGKPGWPAKPKT